MSGPETKILLDNDVPQSVHDAFQARGWRVDLTRDVMERGQFEKDIDILVEACKRNYHLVTMDLGFLKAQTHPCDPKRYARRTVLNLPSYEYGKAERYLRTAWALTTWAGMKIYDAIEIQRDAVLAYECTPSGYKVKQTWPIGRLSA